jgi:ABC-type dipeptide/oligopeptide/nickel transport system permease subunit
MKRPAPEDESFLLAIAAVLIGTIAGVLIGAIAGVVIYYFLR